MRLSFVLIAMLALTFVSCEQDLGITVLSNTAVPLDGTQLVPARPGAGNGTMELAYNRSNRVLTYTINYNSLSGAPSGIAIHGPASVGFNGPIVQNMSGFTAAATGRVTGTLLVDGVLVREADFLRGGYYVAIRTALNPTGEIRGQITVK